MKLKLAVVAVLAAVGVGALGWTLAGAGATSATTPEFLTAEATVGDVREDIAASATIKPVARYGLAFGEDPWVIEDDSTGPAADGTTWPVLTVEVEVGERVSAGQTLATADAAEAEALRADAGRTLRSAEDTLRNAEDELEDAEDADATARIRQARVAVREARTRVAEAERALDVLDATIERATLTAPIDGIVTDVAIREGLDAPAGAAVVIDTTGFEVTADVTESDLAAIEVGQAAGIAIDALDAETTGVVTAISPVATESSGSGVVSYPVTVTIDEAPAAARAGMSADVTITIAEATGVLTVPAAALQGRAGSYAVLVLDPATGTPAPTPVDVGLVTDRSVEIRSGIDEGTTVVTGTAADLVDAGGGFPDGRAFPGGGGAMPITRPGGGVGPDVVVEGAP